MANGNSYVSGNLERWGFAITTYLPQVWTLLSKTIEPMITGSLIELLGSNNQFSKKEGELTPIVDKGRNITGFAVTLSFSVPDFIGYSGTKEAVEQDQTFIYNKIQVIPGAQWRPDCVKISVETGIVQISFILPVGYA